MKMIKWLKKHIWWRFYYTKIKLTTIEAHRGRCLGCHAGIRANPNDKSKVTCYDFGCPCKWNERLITKDNLFGL